MKFTWSILLLALCSYVSAQSLPENYLRPNFASTTGLDKETPTERICYSFFEALDQFEIDPPILTNGRYQLTDQIDRLLDAIQPCHNRHILWVIEFPAAQFELSREQAIKYDNVVLRGAGAGETIFFMRQGTGNCFQVLGRIQSDRRFLVQGNTGSQWIYVHPRKPDALPVGSVVLLEREAVAPVCNIAGIGQMATVMGESGNFRWLDRPLNFGFEGMAAGASVVEIVPRQNIGFENLTLDASERNFEVAVSQASNFSFQLARNCWLRGVESIRPPYQHVRLDKAGQIEIFGCYFGDALQHNGGGGGRGYGINFQNGTTGCRVENNVFQQLRHAIVLQYGSNGNAVAYNYTTGNEPEGDQGLEDLIFHGAFPSHNLVEGNMVEEIEFDLANGWNGPGNIIFRNQVRSKGIRARSFVSTGCAEWARTDQIAVVGNEVATCISLSGKDHFEADNRTEGNLCADEPADDASWMASLLYADRPDWFPVHSAWPLFGPGGGDNAINPAAERSADQEIPVVSVLKNCGKKPFAGPFEVEMFLDTCAGQVMVLPTGGALPYSTRWSGPVSNEAMFKALVPGGSRFEVLVQDANGTELRLGGTMPKCNRPPVIPSESVPGIAQIEIAATVYSLPRQGRTELKIIVPVEMRQVEVRLFDLKGSLLFQQYMGDLSEGVHVLELPGQQLSPGIYLCHIQSASGSRAIKFRK